ncbi:TonB-dependent receptor [Paraglaciecola chathamensis]|uniref:TonB-dependent receptor domain-containing protein n=1 Tax=Paraglaciecola chathamensis TaxID=368405 RepID=UPI0026FE0947|nr:TonB-dependent receptor [Paraglaciecola chathamensis]MDO6841539.1 TonB-dependent receptor [Paraglaciecola chathamensis]
MFTNSKLTKSVRLAMAVGTAAAISSSNVYAQEVASAAAEDAAVEKIQVTGSRIQRANMVSASPVTEISAADIKVSGITRVEDILNDMPAVFAGQTSGTANGATGTATIDLRNLGPERTLVLQNGRRLPSGSPSAGGISADVNQIPAALIERIEVLTGGSSATYGSDAVAGVVNFILKDDFEGFSFDYQHSFYQHDNDNSNIQDLVSGSGFPVASGSVDDGNANDFSFLFGANTDDGRGNVTMYGTFRDIQAVVQSSRDYSSCAINGSPDAMGCGGSSTTPFGRFTDFDTFNFQLSGEEFVPFTDLYNYGPLNYFQRPDERKTFGATSHYEINEHVEVYAELSYMDDRSVAQIAPSGNFFSTDRLYCGNPYLSDQQFAATCGAAGLTDEDYYEGFYIGRRNVEGGPRQDDLRHTSLRGVLGVRGIIDDNWSYDVFANYGTVSYLETYRNELSVDHMKKALDARVDPDSGDIVCASVLDGTDPSCVPWNIFSEGGVTDEALAYLIKPLYSRGDTKSTQVSGYVTGDLTDAGIVVPGTSTGVGLVAGLEYRKEQLILEPDFGFTSGDGAGQGGPTAGVRGDFSVKEIFGELNVPLLEGKEFAEELTLELAYRYSDYSTDKTTNTYKYAMNWGINDQARVRASFQRAVRAGNIRELFRPSSLGLFNMDIDPCGVGGDFTLAQCLNTGLTEAQYQTSALESPAGQYNSITGGNTEVNPEESDTFSFGVALSPEFLPGFTLNIDYFKIEVKDAISSIPETTILQLCGDTGNAAYCDLINRGPNGNLWVGTSSITATDLNIGYLKTEGVDFDANYEMDLGEGGELRLGFIATLLDSLATQSIPGGDIDECAGYWDRTVCGQPTPEWRHNLKATWVSPWDVNVTATWRHMSEVNEYEGVGQEDGPGKIDAQNYLDLSANWQAHENVNLRVGVNNILDRDPPIIVNAPSGSGNGNTFPGFYDALGRYVFGGVTVTF